MKKRHFLLLSLLALAAGAPASAAEARQPITHEKLWLLKQVGAPAPSPDGQWVVVPVSEPAYDEKDESTDLWIVPGDGSAPPRRLTTAKGRESSPAWSPDGARLAFGAKREGDEASQIYIIELAGGEARRLTQVALGARAPRWSPDGQTILFQASVHRDATNDFSNKAIAEERKKAKSKVRVFENFPVRYWDKWLDDVQTHLFVIPSDGSGSARDLLAGTRLVQGPGFHGAFGPGGGDNLEPEWAPDSKSIVFTATTNRHTAAYAEILHHIYEVKLEGGEPRALTGGDINHRKAAFSPDGTRLGFATAAHKGNYYSVTRLATAAWPWDGDIRVLTASFDRSIDEFAFSPDSRTVYFTAGDAGRVRVWSAPVSGGEAQLAIDPPQGGWLSLAIPERAATPLLFGNWEAAHRPGETYRVDLTTSRQTRLTGFNVEAVAGLDLPPLREFWFTNTAGRVTHSFLALPPAFEEAKKYPLLVLLHGGHASMWTDSITRRWNYHLLAAPGYVVLLTDYVGSTGYGEQFTRDILGNPLRGPAEDINAAADEAIRRFSFIDGSRQAAAGASYGGHLANWLEASTTRYRCLISHAGMASIYSQWATSDSIYTRELMMGGPYWEKPQTWLDQSPSTYAGQFKTPMLLSIGENDYRVPLNNVLEMWTLLQRQQVPSRLLVWPDENHWISKGENSRRFYQEVHQWLARWLGTSSSAKDALTSTRQDVLGAKLGTASNLFADYYEERLKLYPLEATIAGDARYNDKMPNELTEEFRAEERTFYRKYLGAVKKLDQGRLSAEEQLTCQILQWQCESGLERLQFATHLLPLNQFRSLHLVIGQWAGGTSVQPFRTVRDYENWLGRLEGFSAWCDTALANMREGMTQGYVLPRALTEKTIPQIAAMAQGPAPEHPYYAPLRQMPSAIPGPEQTRLASAYRDLIERRIIPAFQRLETFLRQEYLPASRASSGIDAIPKGSAFYRSQVKYFTTTDMTAAEIHQLGLREVARLTAEMNQVREQVGFQGSLHQFFEHVRSRKELMPFTDAQRVVANFGALHQRMEPQLRNLFSVVPRTAFEIRRTEAFREKTASAEYWYGSLDGSRPGIFYVPVPEPAEYNVFQDEALFLHEAIPGHHYQFSLQRENSALPMFRRILVHDAFGEGWALYCESLGRELGLYTDPYQQFGSLSMEMHRAIRLVVDTGLHAMGWTREQAIAYSLEHEAESEAGIVAEIERYMAWPGQALPYKIGQLKLRDLRARAEQALGPEFDLREFHTRLLESGCLPLNLLERKLDRWIREKAGSSSPERDPAAEPDKPE